MNSSDRSSSHHDEFLLFHSAQHHNVKTFTQDHLYQINTTESDAHNARHLTQLKTPYASKVSNEGMIGFHD